jgi:RNA polymerase sigma-70 factor (ECF subfamily)
VIRDGPGFTVARGHKKPHKAGVGRDYLPALKTRASLLERLRDWEDQASWEDFFDTYWKLIYSTARKAGLSDEEAQDAVQETMISVSRCLPTFHYDAARGSFKVWLLRLTRWRIVDQFRKRGPIQARQDGFESGDGATEALIENMPDPVTLVPNQVWETDWQKNLAEVALARVRGRVDPRNYQLFDFYMNKEWPAKKVAERFGVSLSQVYLAKCRITAMLKLEIERLENETI